MRRIKYFLEFVRESQISDTKSEFLPEWTYDGLSNKLGCSLDEVKNFETWLKTKMNPSKSFFGSLVNRYDRSRPAMKEKEMFDKIETLDDYYHMWQDYNSEKDSTPVNHGDDEL